MTDVHKDAEDHDDVLLVAHWSLRMAEGEQKCGTCGAKLPVLVRRADDSLKCMPCWSKELLAEGYKPEKSDAT